MDTVSNGITDFALQWRNGLGDLLRAVNMTVSLLGSVFSGLNCAMCFVKEKIEKVLAVRVYHNRFKDCLLYFLQYHDYMFLYPFFSILSRLNTQEMKSDLSL